MIVVPAPAGAFGWCDNDALLSIFNMTVTKNQVGPGTVATAKHDGIHFVGGTRSARTYVIAALLAVVGDCNHFAWCQHVRLPCFHQGRGCWPSIKVRLAKTHPARHQTEIADLIVNPAGALGIVAI